MLNRENEGSAELDRYLEDQANESIGDSDLKLSEIEEQELERREMQDYLEWMESGLVGDSDDPIIGG
jgi:hypothetical protein